MTTQGDTALLDDPIAQAMLQARVPARLAYTWHDGTPRAVPIWFHWTGDEIVLGTPRDAPKVAAIRANPRVALTIDSDDWPAKVLLVRGAATVEIVPGVAPEYAVAANKYLGDEQGSAWTRRVEGMSDTSARIAVRPEWVGILDFQTRFPSAIAKRMG